MTDQKALAQETATRLFKAFEKAQDRRRYAEKIAMSRIGGMENLEAKEREEDDAFNAYLNAASLAASL